ncbi:hypothetical protein K439DRAFT_1612805 [Ramaria rubella]|nr:hypothetical protein K439DRAFT_1612805 [Ramaria rubella]
MADSSFQVPSMIAQDLAIIMGFVDPPQPSEKAELELVRGYKRKGSPNIASRSDILSDEDIASSCAESEDEVEAEIVSLSGLDGNGKKTSPCSFKKPVTSDSESSVSTSSSSGSFQQRKKTIKRAVSPILDPDLDDDGPVAATTYIPTTNELPPAAVPVPPLPDPSTLPQDPLERAGEIATILPDSVIVRGGGASGFNAREKRDAVLDEGSLLLLEDRTPLGYIFETFGPTAQPHYLIRIKPKNHLHGATKVSLPDSGNPSESTEVVMGPTDESKPPLPSSLSPPPPRTDREDPAKFFVSQAVYHISSLSNFVFPSALARFKGSDASNFHDEEPAEHELEFSDDEAEAAHQRVRKRQSSRAPSLAPSSVPYDGDRDGDDEMSTVGDDAGSLYGASPYDYEDLAHREHTTPHSQFNPQNSAGPSSSLAALQDPSIRDALMIARNSRHRRNSSISMSETSTSHPQGHNLSTNGGGRGRGRGRGKDHNRSARGRDRDNRGQPRGRGRGRDQGANLNHRDQGSTQNQRSFFSFDEYDPHMPRPPSPTSLAIARAIGQWSDGTPFSYGAGNAGGNTLVDPHETAQVPSLQPPMPVPVSYGQGPYQSPRFYNDQAAIQLSQASQHQQFQAQPYGVAPHINPRFAQVFGFSGASQMTASVPSAVTLAQVTSDSPSQPPSPEENSGSRAEGWFTG